MTKVVRANYFIFPDQEIMITKLAKIRRISKSQALREILEDYKKGMK